MNSIGFSIFIVLKKLLAISLALLLLGTNLSIALSTHFCGGKAVKSELSIGRYDLDCGMAEMESCESSKRGSNEILPLPCCENLHSFFQINERYQTSSKIEFGLLPIVTFEFFTTVLTRSVFTSSKVYFNTYKPPLPKQGILVLHQVFRI